MEREQILEGLKAALGDEWNVMNAWYLQRAGTEEKLSVHTSGWAPKGMIHISGIFPDGPNNYCQYYRPREGNYSINVSESKTFARIAQDIDKRLLGDYRKALADALERRAQDEAAYNAGQTLAEELAQLVGSRRGDGDGTGVYRIHAGPLRLMVGPGEHVKIEYGYLDADQARRVVAALAEPRVNAEEVA